jgi:hypothetical protein
LHDRFSAKSWRFSWRLMLRSLTTSGYLTTKWEVSINCMQTTNTYRVQSPLQTCSWKVHSNIIAHLAEHWSKINDILIPGLGNF